MRTLTEYETGTRIPIMLSAYELRAIIQAVHKDREYSPEPNIMRPTERDHLLNRLRNELANTIEGA